MTNPLHLFIEVIAVVAIIDAARKAITLFRASPYCFLAFAFDLVACAACAAFFARSAS
jgi:hypothetical protein